MWSPAGFDEHPPHVSDPTYVTKGQDLVWQRVQAVIDGGGWADTTFILTWDDWGGYTDSVPTPVIETVPDALHPNGFAAIGGSRIPLLMFGGMVGQRIDAAVALPRVDPEDDHRPARAARDGSASRGHRAVFGRTRRPSAEPTGAPAARDGDHPADPTATTTRAGPTGTVARSAQPTHAAADHPGRQRPARTDRRCGPGQTTRTPQTALIEPVIPDMGSRWTLQADGAMGNFDHLGPLSRPTTVMTGGADGVSR